MKTRWIISLTGLVFLVSFFLPAYYTYSGYECAKQVLNVLVRPIIRTLANDGPFSMGIGETIYYGIFNATNICTVLLIVTRIAKPEKCFSPIVKVGYTFLMLHTLSWWLAGGREDIKIGYYVWLTSILIICVYTWFPMNRNRMFRERMKHTLSAVYLFLYLGILLFSALNQTANEYPGWLTALDFSCSAGAVVCMMLYVIRLRPIFLSPLWKLVPIILVMYDGLSWYYDFIVFADPEYKIPEIVIATCLGIIILFPSWYLCFRYGYMQTINGASENKPAMTVVSS